MPGSAGTACSRPFALVAAIASTPPRTSSASARMRQHLQAGLSAAEAARQALAEPPDGVRDEPVPAAAAVELRRALEQLDDAGAHAAFDRLLADYSQQTVLAAVVLPRAARARGRLGARHDLRRAGALRVEPSTRTAARPRSRLGSRLRPARRAGVPARASGTTSASSSSGLPCASTAGGSRSSGRIRRRTPSSRQSSRSRRTRSCLRVADPARLEGVAATITALDGAATAVWVGGAGAEKLDGARVCSRGQPLEAAAQVAG